MSLDSNLLPRYYKVEKNNQNKGIKYEMERGLVFPMVIDPIKAIQH
jgi:hypothetical protein